MKKAYWKVLPYLAGTIIVAIFALSVEGLLSIKMMKTIDAALGGNRELLLDEVKYLLMITLLVLPFQLLLVFSKAMYKRKAITNLKWYYINEVFYQDISSFHSENAANHISAMTNDVNTIENNYVEGVYEVAYGVASFLVGIAVIAYVNPVILVVGAGFGVLSAVLSSLLGKPVQKHHSQRSILFGNYTVYIKEFLGAFQIIKANNLSSKVKSDFEVKSKAIQDKGYVIDKIFTFISALQNLMMTLLMFGIVGFSVYMALKGEITFGGVILVVNNMEKTMFPLSQIGEWMPKIISTKGLFEKLDQGLKREEHNDEILEVDAFRESFRFESVAFGYDEKSIFEDVDLEFKKGGKYLLVGPSGGGKSTLLRLFRKYVKPNGGRMLLDGNDIAHIKKASFYKLISNVEQQVFLFEDTLKNNIALHKECTDEALERAIHRAGLDDFVLNHPDGVNRMILDNGKNISGGERSRIAIARGLLQEAQIILLDEAFASLDETVAKEIEMTLLSLKDITVINVSHVIFDETKKKYDQIYRVGHRKVHEVLA
ncbi:MAG: ABC transporter ATP-binding protein/permease [Clostridiales bacterium]|nr:ABC transporter ATP-binding protein/permease [Clostridiales bacterium]